MSFFEKGRLVRHAAYLEMIMGLSCSCDWDYDEPEWYWWPPKDYSVYKKWRSQKCCCNQCANRVSYNDIVAEVTRSRQYTEWELNHIGGWGDEGDPEAVWLASVYMCERCTDLFFSFDDLGFECVSPYEDMLGLAKEYHDTYQISTTKSQVEPASKAPGSHR